MKEFPMTSESTQRGDNPDYRDPSAIVYKYLQEEFLNLPGRAGERVPPVRTLAHQLGVSATVVHQVFRNLQEEGRLVSTVGKGTYVSKLADRRSVQGRSLCLGLTGAISNGSGSRSSWNSKIMEGLFYAAGRTRTQISFLPCPLDGVSSPLPRSVVDAIDTMDGLILLPGILDEGAEAEFRSLIREKKRPIISINAPQIQSTANFVSTDFYAASEGIGKALLSAGRRKLLFLGTNPIGGSVSALQRIHGLQSAIQALDLAGSASLECVGASDISLEAGYTVMRRHLTSSTMPDAIIAFGDMLAMGAIKALQSFGRTIPSDVSVVGGSGLVDMFSGELATTAHPFNQIGEAALEMFLTILESGKDQPGRYVPMGIFTGKTLRPEEAGLLGPLDPIL